MSDLNGLRYAHRHFAMRLTYYFAKISRNLLVYVFVVPSLAMTV